MTEYHREIICLVVVAIAITPLIFGVIDHLRQIRWEETADWLAED